MILRSLLPSTLCLELLIEQAQAAVVSMSADSTRKTGGERVTREKLPNLRGQMTFEFAHAYPGADPHTWTASIGFYADGRPAEIFVSLVDRRAKISVDALDAAVLISFALQHGATLERMGAAMTRGEDGTPHRFKGALIDAALEAA